MSERVLIVGAARGIGAASARLLARRGARLILDDVGCDREGRGSDPAAVQALGDELEVPTSDLDARDPEAPARWLALADERHGGLDAAIWCAGVRRERSVLKTSPDDLDHELELQLRAPIRLLQTLSRRWIEAKIPGSFVVLTGAPAFFGQARQAASGAAGAGIVAFLRSAALELRRHRIRVNVVVPTARTRQTEDLPLFQRIAEDSMSVDHVAPVLAYLVSEESAHVSGEVLGVAGGRFYGFQSRETTGAISETGPFSQEELVARWSEATRG